jgi:hypothetical protein
MVLPLTEAVRPFLTGEAPDRNPSMNREPDASGVCEDWAAGGAKIAASAFWEMSTADVPLPWSSWKR